MPDGLAVFTPFVGLPSETFIRRHLTGLAPGRTLTVTTTMEPPTAPVWSAPEPVVSLRGATISEARHQAQRFADKLRARPRGRWRWVPSRSDLRELAGALDEVGADAVLIEYLDVFLPLVPWLTDRSRRVFVHAHGYDVSVRMRNPWWRRRYQQLGLATGVITVSEHAKANLVDRIGLPEELVHVAPCGVEVDDAPPVPPPLRDTVEVVAVGRLVPKKHPLATIEAMRLASLDAPQLRLTIVGEGPLWDDAADAVRDARLGDHVRLLGARPHAEALALVGAADIFVQHSVRADNGDEEGLPVGILEAMARAVPVVSTRHAGIPEAVEEGVTGLLVQEGDVEGMAAALVELAHDAPRRRALGVAGHARALERFSWTRERREKRALLGLDPVRV